MYVGRLFYFNNLLEQLEGSDQSSEQRVRYTHKSLHIKYNNQNKIILFMFLFMSD